MREIKFRVWDREENVMAYGIGLNLEYFVNENQGKYEILQYTGLKDKNEKEIYEGDILKCDEAEHIFDMETRVLQSFNNASVTFYDGSFMYNPRCNKNQPHQLLSLARNIEIIGNIYENPNLIK